MTAFEDEMALNRKPLEFSVKPADLIGEFSRFIMENQPRQTNCISTLI